MKGLLTITDTPVGGHPQGSYMVVETKQVGRIQFDMPGNIRLTISCFPGDWGGEVKGFFISFLKVKESSAENIKGVKVLNFERDSRPIELPDELIKKALALAKLKREYETMQREFRKGFLGILRGVIGPLHTSKGDRIIGGKNKNKCPG